MTISDSVAAPETAELLDFDARNMEVKVPKTVGIDTASLAGLGEPAGFRK